MTPRPSAGRLEHRSEPLASRAVFAQRVGLNVLLAVGVILIALAGGMIGYRVTENMDWLDAFLNAAMLLGGMGPVSDLHTTAGKIFAGVYALMCGLLLVAVTGLILAPVLHRVLHALHVKDS